MKLSLRSVVFLFFPPAYFIYIYIYLFQIKKFFFIPTLQLFNVQVYINLWSLHHDESVWPNPWTFNPSRFLDSNGKLLPSSHENRRRLMPFGAGRRVCLGETLAKNRLFLFATSLVQNFFFQAEDEKNLPEVDPQAYEMGLVLHPKSFRLQAVHRESK